MPIMIIAGERCKGMPLDLGQMDFSGPPRVGEASAYTTELMQRPLATTAVDLIAARLGLWTPGRSSDDTKGLGQG